MKRIGTSEMERLLGAQRFDSPAGDAPEFWADFKARAGLRNQDRPGDIRLPRFSTGWAIAAACAMLIVSFGVFHFRGAAVLEPSRVISLEVGVADSAVLMARDEASNSTILVLVGTGTSGEGG